MKAVLISIKPKWCEAIAVGEKTIEVRKTAPKCEVPFKVYIYETKESKRRYLDDRFNSVFSNKSHYTDMGKVIGEFICDKIDEIIPDYNPVTEKFYYGYVIDITPTCLSEEEIQNYGGNKPLYFWHISDLKIYDKPKVLRVFKKPCPHGEDMSCYLCEKSGYAPDMHLDCFNAVTRPPQSWCYVDELEVE